MVRNTRDDNAIRTNEKRTSHCGSTEAFNKEVKHEFYENLLKLLHDIHPRNEIILMGDLNARTDTSKNCNTVGKYGENAANDSGYPSTPVSNSQESYALLFSM